MKKGLRKFLSILLVYSMIFTTNSFTVFADITNNEETVVENETTSVDETTTIEDIEEAEEIDETEETVVYEENNLSEDETLIPSDNEELLDEEIEMEEVDAEAEETTSEEELIEEEETTTLETEKIANKKVEDMLFGDNNFKFSFKMQDGFGWYNKEDGDTEIEYDTDDDIEIPVVYSKAGQSAGYVWIDYGWAKDVGGHAGGVMTEDQLKKMIDDWKANPTEDIIIYPNFQQFAEGNMKTPPDKTKYFTGEEIDSTGIVFELTNGDKKKEVPYELPQYARLYSREILDADKKSLGWDKVTADTKYCRFHFDDMIYVDVELEVKTLPSGYKFKFIVPGPEDDPDPLGWFNSEGGPRRIEYKSEDLITAKVEIPVFYRAEWSGNWTDPDWINVGWINETDDNKWISDDDLNILVESWNENPTADVTVRVNMSQIWNSSLKTPPTKTKYFVGDEFDPTGLVFEVSDEMTSPATWTKDISYDEPQYKRLFAYQLLNESEGVIEGKTITDETKYCKFIYNTRNEHKIELKVLSPHTFTFITNAVSPQEFGYFDEAQTISQIVYKSEELDTKPIEIPLVYVVDIIASQMEWIDLGWKDVNQKKLSDDEFKALIKSWSDYPDSDVTVYVNFERYFKTALKKKPDRLKYTVGDKLELDGVAIKLLDSNNVFMKDVAYEDVQYKRLFSTQLTDKDHNVIESDTITADTKYGRYRFNETKYEDIELDVTVPYDFTFEVGEDLAHFNAEDGPTSITFNSLTLDTNPIKTPVVYLTGTTTTENRVNVGWKNFYDGDKKITDKELEKLISDWSKKPDRDIKITVNFETVESSRVKTPPDRVEYWIGDTFEPAGLVIEVSDASKTWTKDIPYDSPEFNRLYSYKLYDKDDQEIVGYNITAETKYCKYIYDTNITEDVDIKILERVTEISLVKPQNWKEYSTGENFDARGLVIHAKYDDGKEEDVYYDNKRVLFLFDPFQLTSTTTKVTVIYGGQTATTHVTMVDNVYALYYYNMGTDSVHSIYTYPGDENNVISALNNAVSSGATGFYRIDDATGYYDAYKKYKKSIDATLTKDEALSVYREEYDGNSSIYIGASFVLPPTPPTPPTPPSPTPGGGGSGSSSPSVGPMGDLTKDQNAKVPTKNNIPQSSLLVNNELAFNLMIIPENQNRGISNATDIYGNAGFGQWLKVPNTATWYFMSGDMNAHGTKGSVGFLANGWFNLGWAGQNKWYHFDANGVMTLGWYEENGKIYYLQNNLTDNWYGNAVTGIQFIDGKEYRFDNEGVLKQ